MLLRYFRERQRAKTVDALRLAQGAAEPGIERYAQQAAEAFAAPVALITLLDENRQWVASSHGAAPYCMPRKDSFCTHVLDRGRIVEICDPLGDARSRHLPTVIGEPGIRYYIGTPLTLHDRLDVGALCVVDMRERQAASPDQRSYLTGLARQVSAVLERRLAPGGRLAA